MKFISVLCVTFFLFNCVNGESVKIAIHHWNDIGSQLEQFLPLTDISTEIPIPCPMTITTQCMGGHGRLIYAAKADLSSVVPNERNILRMTSGNLVGGESGWLSSVGWKEFGSLVNLTYKLDAMSLGMKEFGAGLKRTNEYLEAAGVHPVLTNVDCSSSTISQNDTEYIFCTNYRRPSDIIYVHSPTGQEVKIGIVGFINQNVEKLGSPGKLQFTDIVTALKSEVNKLKNEGVRFIVALGDGSLTTAQNIIDEVPEIKVVIYGMGFSSSKDMTGEYPMKYKNSYIGTARIYGGTIGTMVIQFDSSSGNIENVDGSRLVKLSNDYQVDTDAQGKVSDFRNKYVSEDANKEVGQTLVKIHGGQLCWENECNLGNLMADAALHCVYNQNITRIPFDFFPAGSIAAVWHGGALYYDKIQRMELITKLDIHRWLPYHNMVDLVSLNGSSLRTLFGLSASALDEDNSRHPKWGQFLQVSNGLQVTYSTSGGVGKVESIRVSHDVNSIPTMDEIQDDLLYLLVVPSYIHEGRSIFGEMKNLFLNIPQAKEGYYQIDFDDDCLENYIQAMNKIAIGFEERIFIDVVPPSSSSKCKNNKAKHVLLTLLVTFLLLALVFALWKFVWPRYRDRNSYPANQN